MLEKLKTAVDKLLARVNAVKGRGEEVTKQSLVLPMLDALGWDIWDPSEICPEFDADVAIKKAGQKEKVDYAVVSNGTPQIYIEVKSIETNLDGHEGQLKRYYNTTPSVCLGVLTNGIEYRFFTDTGDANIMDEEPFFFCHLDAVDQGLDVLIKFSKKEFAVASVRDYATDLKYTAKITRFLKTELDAGRDPSEEFVRWILSLEYPGRVTQAVVEKFRPIIRTSLSKVFMDVVRRSVAAIDTQINTSQPVAPPIEQEQPDIQVEKAEEGKSKIITTERELAVFANIQKIFDTSTIERTIFDATLRKEVPVELKYKDTTAYFGMYLNKSKNWFLRFFDGKDLIIALNLNDSEGCALLPEGFERVPANAHGSFRVKIFNPEDLFRLEVLIREALQKTIKESRE